MKSRKRFFLTIAIIILGVCGSISHAEEIENGTPIPRGQILEVGLSGLIIGLTNVGSNAVNASGCEVKVSFENDDKYFHFLSKLDDEVQYINGGAETISIICGETNNPTLTEG